jgi:hypothetical protein
VCFVVAQPLAIPLVTAQVPITALSVYSSSTGADRGGNHIKQTAHDGSSRRQTGNGGCLSGDFPADFC